MESKEPTPNPYGRAWAIRQWLIGATILFLGLAGLYVMWNAMDKVAGSFSINKDKLGEDYSTIFKKPLEQVRLVSALRIPDARFVYVLESTDPLVLRQPLDFPQIDLNRGNWWPYGSFPWITRCLYKPSGIGDSAKAKGEIFVYCDDDMKHACVLGYYGEDSAYLPMYPGAINVQTPETSLRTGKYEKLVEFDVPAPVTADKVFEFYTNGFQHVGWKLQPSQDKTARDFLCGRRKGGVRIENQKDHMHVRVIIGSLAL